MRVLMYSLLSIVLAWPAMAGEPSERVFSRTALDGVKDNHQVIYTHVRTGEVRPISNGEIRVKVEPHETGRKAVVTMGEEGKLQPVSSWPASSGNPVLPIFLESTLRTMAQATGGSEFYIRNRIKEALGTGGTMNEISLDMDGKAIPATEITFAPFADDKNRARMGGYAELKLVFVVSEALPGDIVRFAAVTGDRGLYLEEIAFARLAEGE
ncbi:MAG: hypothetical protein AAGH68_10700 [Pseudomonadota bacterium]